MISNNLSQQRLDHISSLILSRQPIIFSGKFKVEVLIDFVLSIFSSIFSINNQPIKRTHPDVLIVECPTKYYSIKTIRSIDNFITKVNFELESQLILLDNLEGLRTDSANAMLRILEESGTLDYNICFLTSLTPSLVHNKLPGILDTILSRCSLVYIPELRTAVNVASESRYSTFSRLLAEKKLSYPNPNNYVTILTQLGLCIGE